MERMAPADAAVAACVATDAAEGYLASGHHRRVRVSPVSGYVYPPPQAYFDVRVAPGDDLQHAVDECPPDGSVLLLEGVHSGHLKLSAARCVHIFGAPNAVMAASVYSSALRSTLSGLHFREDPQDQTSKKKPYCVFVADGGLRVQECVFEGAAFSVAVGLSKGEGATVQKCRFLRSDVGIEVRRSKLAHILGNVFSGMKFHGVDFVDAEHLHVIMGGNTFEKCRHFGIHMCGDVLIHRILERDTFRSDNACDIGGPGFLYHRMWCEHANNLALNYATYASLNARLEGLVAAVREPPRFTSGVQCSPNLLHTLVDAKNYSHVLVAPGVYHVKDVAPSLDKTITLHGRGLVTLYVDASIRVTGKVTLVGMRVVHVAERPGCPLFVVSEGGHLILQACVVETEHVGVQVQEKASTAVVASRVGRVCIAPHANNGNLVHRSDVTEMVVGTSNTFLIENLFTRSVLVEEGVSVIAIKNEGVQFIRK